MPYFQCESKTNATLNDRDQCYSASSRARTLIKTKNPVIDKILIWIQKVLFLKLDTSLNPSSQLYTCENINATTCVSVVSNYEAHKNRDYLEHYQVNSENFWRRFYDFSQ